MDPDPLPPDPPGPRRHGDMDDARAALPNPRERRATHMRQHRPGPTRQHRREPIALLPEPIMSVGVNTAVKADEGARSEPTPRSRAQPSPITDELLPRHHAPLPRASSASFTNRGGRLFRSHIAMDKRPTPRFGPGGARDGAVLYRCRYARVTDAPVGCANPCRRIFSSGRPVSWPRSFIPGRSARPSWSRRRSRGSSSSSPRSMRSFTSTRMAHSRPRPGSIATIRARSRACRSR